MKFTQKAGYVLSHDVCHSLCHNYSTEIDGVVNKPAHYLLLKAPPRDHSDGSTYLSDKSFSSSRQQDAIFSRIVDVYQAYSDTLATLCY